MSRLPHGSTIRVHELMGRSVYDARGNNLGRVYDFVAEREGDELRISALLVGIHSLWGRFSWRTGQHGQQIPWDCIAQLSPDIRLRGDGSR